MNKLKELYDIYSVSSCEKNLNKFLKNEFEKYGGQIVEDNLYSVFTKIKGKEDIRVMLTCAMDEIGMMVESINDDGSLNFICLEKQSPASLLNQRVNIITRDYKNIKGVISIDKKILEKSIEKVAVEDLKIDIFYPDFKTTRVKVGDLVCLEADLIETEDMYIGRSLNQKIPQMIILEVLKRFNKELAYDLYLGSIAQSTIGFRGTKTATYVVNPHIGLVITGFEVNNSMPKIKLGDGIIVGHFDSQMIPSKKLLDFVEENYETKPYLGILGNDGSFIHKTMDGAATLSFGIPMKNIGTSSVMVLKSDIEILINSLVDLLEKIQVEDILERGI